MRFRLSDFPNASNQSLTPSRVGRLARKMRELFIEGETCECCGTKIREYFFRSVQTLSMRQCHVECGGCGGVFHFLCYLEAMGADKGEGAAYGWPKGDQGERLVAPCPKCKKNDVCRIVLEGIKKPFARTPAPGLSMEKEWPTGSQTDDMGATSFIAGDGAQTRMADCMPIQERAFSHIEIGIHKYCNSKCPFCPHGQEESSSMPKGTMPEELYLKVLGDLKEMGFRGRISFHLMNEPLLCKNLVRFIRLAREYCNDACILIITNGSVLSYRYLAELFESGADRIAINHYSKARSRVVFPLINALAAVVKMSRRGAVSHRLSSLVCLGAYYLLTLDGSSKKYFRIFLGLEGERMARVSFSITKFYTNYSNRAGNLKTKVLNEPLKEFCIYPFVQMYITYDGKAVICSADYFHREVVGDVRSSSLLEIWNGSRYRMIRSKLFRGDRGGLICGQCDTMFLYEPDLYYPVPGDR